MNDLIDRKPTVQRFDFLGDVVYWTSYKIEKDDISRSYATCQHRIFKKYFGNTDTLVSNLVNLSQMLEDGSEDELFFTLLLNSYIIE
jgi:hypothetical protein